MQISIKDKNSTENIDNIQLQKNDNEVLINTNQSFSELLQGKIIENKDNINNIENTDFIDFSYDSINMNINDALFFINLTQNAQFNVQTLQTGEFQNLIKTDIVQNTVSKKSVEVTNQITSLIEQAMKTQKSVRISFDNKISVILKIDKQGKLNAEFIPGSIEAENYLMNNISSLKQKFDEQNLPYTNLSYRQNGKGNKNKDKEKNRGNE